MTNETNILPHFRPEEHPFVERSFDWIRQATQRSKVIITPFLDPREQFIIQSLVQRESDLVIEFDGGYDGAERCEARIAPEYFYLDDEPFPLTFLRLNAEVPLEHREVLGSLMGLGISRQKLGDILPASGFSQVILATEMKDYVLGNLTKVGRKRVDVEEIHREQLLVEPHQELVKQTTVSSLRLDTFIAASCGLSRAKAVELVHLGRCKVNWRIIDHPDYSLVEGDVLSVRGYGRIRFLEMKEITKKGRFPIRYSRNI